MSEWQPPEISLFFRPHEMCVSGFQAVDEDILTGTEAVGDGHEIGQSAVSSTVIQRFKGVTSMI